MDNQQKTLELGTKPVGQLLTQYALPAIIAMVASSLYNITDSIFIGQGVGALAISGLAITFPFMNLSAAFGAAVGIGSSTCISINLGQKNYRMAQQIFGSSITLNIIMGVAFAVVSLLFLDPILKFFGASEATLPYAREYMIVILLGNPLTHLFFGSNALLRAAGKPRHAMYSTILSVLLNIIFSPLFIWPLHMGIQGAALATVISQAASGLACLLYIHARVPALHLSGSHLRPSLRRMVYIASIGVPMGLQFSITAVGSIILQGAVNSLGAGAVAAVSAGSRVHNIMAAPMETAGITMATYCGQNLGAGKPDRIRKGVMAITWVTIGYSLLAFGVNYFAGTSIACLFMDASETAILAQVHRYLTINGAAYPLLVLIFIFRNSLQGMGYSSSAMFAGLAELIARSIVAFGFVGRFAFGAVCFANPLAWLFADLILLPLYAVKLRRLDLRFAAQAQEEDSSLSCLPSPKCKKA